MTFDELCLGRLPIAVLCKPNRPGLRHHDHSVTHALQYHGTTPHTGVAPPPSRPRSHKWDSPLFLVFGFEGAVAAGAGGEAAGAREGFAAFDGFEA